MRMRFKTEKEANQVVKMKNIEDQTAILLVPSYPTLTLTLPILLDWMQVYKPQTLMTLFN